ncbi:hypothetical protein G6F35_019017 [Rhizopus arrhizus]|nr:hypothetical protein G6F40_016235 [Rhizopus arrhizus]KAG1164925.1 hypothetical protein G6F35_019017 [Rhizopus arrhizus]KAG1251883.1 hypothetical protein G6F66_015261 [Rhizopus arrhizus]
MMMQNADRAAFSYLTRSLSPPFTPLPTGGKQPERHRDPPPGPPEACADSQGHAPPAAADAAMARSVPSAAAQPVPAPSA